MIISKEHKIFLSEDFIQDKYLFTSIIENLSSPNTKLYSDEKNYIICQNTLEKPIIIWTKDNFNKECLKELEQTINTITDDNFKHKYICKKELSQLLTLNKDSYLEISFLICEKTIKPPKCDGYYDIATSKDKDILAKYWYYDHIESKSSENISLKESTKFVEKLLKETTIHLWKNSNNEIVSIAYHQTINNQTQINGVYTHPEYRRNYYASNLVYKITNDIISQKKMPLLYTDSNYLPANKTYINLGYKHSGTLVSFIYSPTKKKRAAALQSIYRGSSHYQ